MGIVAPAALCRALIDPHSEAAFAVSDAALAPDAATVYWVARDHGDLTVIVPSPLNVIVVGPV